MFTITLRDGSVIDAEEITYREATRYAVSGYVWSCNGNGDSIPASQVVKVEPPLD